MLIMSNGELSLTLHGRERNIKSKKIILLEWMDGWMDVWMICSTNTQFQPNNDMTLF